VAALALYLIGAPGAGKTAVFEALTNTPQGPHFTSKGAHRIGAVKVPDHRLEKLRDMYHPKKFTPAEVTFVDVALPAAPDGRQKLEQLTPFLSEADAFVLVVQAFGDIDGQGRPLDPVKQMESVLLELMVSDLEKIERRFEKLDHEKKRGTRLTPESEVALMQHCRKRLDEGRPLRGMEFKDEDLKLLRNYGFLSHKPVLVVANVDEARLPDAGATAALEAAAAEQGFDFLRFCAPLEAEIARLDAAEQPAFLKDYGLEEPAGPRLLRTAYHLLSLISFFTVGDDEVRAWTLRRGATAHKAAGKIHSDIERGFIRAETVAWDKLLADGAWAAARDHAHLRLEGKEYPVQDGDVINFRFNA
jgi:GTP-binding protein YchF